MAINLNNESRLTYKKIFLLWIPLAAMWLMMGIEMPLINAVIARLNDAKANLAAFGVTLAIALIIESPIIQLLAAGTALADSRKNYKRLMSFMHILAISLTIIHLILALTPLYGLLLQHVLRVPTNIIPLSRRAFILMCPFSAAVGYRRLWQGVLIRFGKTKVIPNTMITRLLTTAIILFAGFHFPGISGAEVGGMALSFGVVAGAISSYIYLRPMLYEFKDTDGQEVLSWNKLLKFYFPLALTNFVTFIVRPVLTFGIARAIFPLESLAIWPVVTSLMFLFRSMSLAYQEVAVSLLKGDDDYKYLSRFAALLGISLSIMFFAIAVTPLGNLWYRFAAGLDKNLLSFTRIPTLIVSVVPAITGFISWYRGVLIFKQKTAIIAKAVMLNSSILMVIILIGPEIFPVQGGIIAALAFMISMLFEAFFLKYATRAMTSV